MSIENSYLLGKLSPESQKFIGFLSFGTRTRALQTSLAIAKATARLISLPTSPVDNLEQFYKATSLIDVQNKIGAMNELVVIDTKTILEYVYRFYAARYYAVFPQSTIFCQSAETAIQDFFGLTLTLDEAAINALKAEPTEVTRIHNATVLFLEELTKAN